MTASKESFDVAEFNKHWEKVRAKYTSGNYKGFKKGYQICFLNIFETFKASTEKTTLKIEKLESDNKKLRGTLTTIDKVLTLGNAQRLCKETLKAVTNSSECSIRSSES